MPTHDYNLTISGAGGSALTAPRYRPSLQTALPNHAEPAAPKHGAPPPNPHTKTPENPKCEDLRQNNTVSQIYIKDKKPCQPTITT